MVGLAKNAVKREGSKKVNVAVKLELSSDVAALDVCSPPKRRKDLGVRVVGGRIYDSENGQTCHQCRQKTIDMMATCKQSNGPKMCTQKYCNKCLLNRYGQNVGDVAEMATWSCPRCLGICNCSICMKKKGQTPTGILVHTAKAIGCGSVAELLLKCPKVVAESFIRSSEPQILGETCTPNKNGAKNHLKTSVASKSNADSLLSGKQPKDKKSSSSQCASPSKRMSKGNDNSSKGKTEKKRTGKKGNATMNGSVKQERTEVNIKEEVGGVNGFSSQACKSPNVRSTSKSDSLTGSAKKQIKRVTASVSGLQTNGEKMQQSENSSRSVTKKLVLDQKFPCDLPMEVSKKKKREHLLTVNGKVEGLGKSKKQKMAIKVESVDLNIKDEPDTKALELKGKKGEDKSKLIPKAMSDKESKVTKQKKPKVVVPEVDISLLKGEQLSSVSGIDLPLNAVGPALQLVEFCSAFHAVFGFKKGEVESLLRELLRGGHLRRGTQSLTVQLHVKLLSLIEEGLENPCKVTSHSSGKNSWLQVLCRHLNERSPLFSRQAMPLKGETIEASQSSPELYLTLDKDLATIKEGVETGAQGYESLDLCNKLQLLNSLCDDCLDTESIRSHIESMVEKYREAQKEIREEVGAAKKEAREAFRKMKDAEVAKLLASSDMVASSVSPEEKEAIIHKAKEMIGVLDTAKSVALEATLKMRKQSCDAVRTDAVAARAEDGRLFYRLKGVNERMSIVFQDISNNTVPSALKEVWSILSKEEEATLDLYLNLKRSQKCISNNMHPAMEKDGFESEIKVEM